jgi:hypothetical protein
MTAKNYVYGIYVPTRIEGDNFWLHRGSVTGLYYYATLDKEHVYTFDTAERAQLALNAPDMPVSAKIGRLPKWR